MIREERKKNIVICEQGVYARYIKRILDFTIALVGLIVLSPILVFLVLVGIFTMRGNPFFSQLRPGKNEKIFKLVKFRTMSNAKDKNGELLPDEVRLNKYGKFLRSTSLDELPELWNILKGDLSIVGPRPQLVRDMVFMNEKQRQRHYVRQGLTGLAQVNGRNNISWEEKFQWDLRYVQNVTFSGDIQIIFKTIGKVLKRSDTVREGTASDLDFGDYLLFEEKIDREEYDAKQKLAKQIIENYMRN